jgi:hypothetical protein
MSSHTLFRISSTKISTPRITVFASNTEDELRNEIKRLLNCDDLESQDYTFWCTDGLRHELRVYMDGEGRDPKALEPNHRANAMADAGRFVTTDFNMTDDESRNQQLKEAQGSNYFFGDIIIVNGERDPQPDMSVYGQNPVRFITTIKTPSVDMIANLGERNALFKTHYALVHVLAINISSEENVSREDLADRCNNTVYQPYYLAPRLRDISSDSYNHGFSRLMVSWGLICGYTPNFTSVLEEMRIFRETGHIGNVHFPNHSRNFFYDEYGYKF